MTDTKEGGLRMAQAKAQATRSSSAPSHADPLNEIRKTVRADRSKIADVPVASLELKRSASTLGKV